jgi:hypothetical protein
MICHRPACSPEQNTAEPHYRKHTGAGHLSNQLPSLLPPGANHSVSFLRDLIVLYLCNSCLRRRLVFFTMICCVIRYRLFTGFQWILLSNNRPHDPLAVTLVHPPHDARGVPRWNPVTSAPRHQRHGRQLHEEGASRARGRTGLALHPQPPAAAFEFRCSSRYAAVQATSCKAEEAKRAGSSWSYNNERTDLRTTTQEVSAKRKRLLSSPARWCPAACQCHAVPPSAAGSCAGHAAAVVGRQCRPVERRRGVPASGH